MAQQNLNAWDSTQQKECEQDLSTKVNRFTSTASQKKSFQSSISERNLNKSASKHLSSVQLETASHTYTIWNITPSAIFLAIWIIEHIRWKRVKKSILAQYSSLKKFILPAPYGSYFDVRCVWHFTNDCWKKRNVDMVSTKQTPFTLVLNYLAILWKFIWIIIINNIMWERPKTLKKDGFRIVNALVGPNLRKSQFQPDASRISVFFLEFLFERFAR